MTTYYKFTTVWEKASFDTMSANALTQIETKKAEMQTAGTMHEAMDQLIDETDVTIIHKFTTQQSAEEWDSFIDGIATSNSLNKISSRITSVTHP